MVKYCVGGAASSNLPRKKMFFLQKSPQCSFSPWIIFIHFFYIVFNLNDYYYVFKWKKHRVESIKMCRHRWLNYLKENFFVQEIKKLEKHVMFFFFYLKILSSRQGKAGKRNLFSSIYRRERIYLFICIDTGK